MTCIRPGECAVCQESIRDPFGSAPPSSAPRPTAPAPMCPAPRRAPSRTACPPSTPSTDNPPRPPALPRKLLIGDWIFRGIGSGRGFWTPGRSNLANAPPHPAASVTVESPTSTTCATGGGSCAKARTNEATHPRTTSERRALPIIGAEGRDRQAGTVVETGFRGISPGIANGDGRGLCALKKRAAGIGRGHAMAFVKILERHG